jgi:hypothetical protein
VARGDARKDHRMHVSFGHALVVTAFVASLLMVFQRGDRLFPLIAVAAAGLEMLLTFGLMSLSLAKFRIDVVLPALIVLGGAVTWSRSESKGSVTSSTVATLAGALQLVFALHVLD